MLNKDTLSKLQEKCFRMSTAQTAQHDWEQDETGYTSSEDEDNSRNAKASVRPIKSSNFKTRTNNKISMDSDTYVDNSMIPTLHYAPGISSNFEC